MTKIRGTNQYRTRAASGEDSSIFITSAGTGKNSACALFVNFTNRNRHLPISHDIKFFQKFFRKPIFVWNRSGRDPDPVGDVSKPLKVVGRTPGRTPLGIFCWLEVINFDPFLGFLLLGRHVCYFSLAGSFI